jgi:anti-sigma factor RsiW
MVNCKRILDELSNYIDDDIDPELKGEIKGHLKMCKRCSVLHDSLRKTLVIVADERRFEIPLGYSERLHAFIDRKII